MGRYATPYAGWACPTAGRRFYDVHVEADLVHGVVARSRLAGGLARQEPDLSADIVFGARALSAVEARFAGHLLESWDQGLSSLRGLKGVGTGGRQREGSWGLPRPDGAWRAPERGPERPSSSANDLQAGGFRADKSSMNRTSVRIGLLGVIFLSAVAVGLVVGEEDRPVTQVAASDTIVDSPATTVVRVTTTVPAATTTTVAPVTTTAAPPTTVRRPVVTVATVVTLPPVTEPPVTEPPTTLAPTTTAPGYDPIKCAEINNAFDVQGQHDNPDRIPLLQAFHCPELYWQ